MQKFRSIFIFFSPNARQMVFVSQVNFALFYSLCISYLLEQRCLVLSHINKSIGILLAVFLIYCLIIIYCVIIVFHFCFSSYFHWNCPSAESSCR